MNKIIKTLITALLCSTPLFASHSDCFRNYTVTLVNRSGGDADFEKTQGVRGVSRHTKLDNNSSIQILIQKRGANIEVKAGPEGNKSNRNVHFYSKDFRNHRPTVTLNQKGLTADGFSQKPISFNVKIENQSGGTAQIIDACDSSGRGNSISDGKTTSISVKPSGYIIVEAGPEKQKIRSKIVFAEQTGDQPAVTLIQRGFMSKGIQGRDLEIQAQRIPLARMKRAKPAHTATEARQERTSKKISFRRQAIQNKPAYINPHVRRSN